MAGFLSSDLITSIQSKFDILHATFAKAITVFKTKKKDVVISTNNNYNSIYRRTNQGVKRGQEVEVSETFVARIYYLDADKSEVTAAQDNVAFPAGSVKIIVDRTGYEYIREAKNVTFDNNKFSISSDARPYGFTSNQFFCFILKPLDEN